MSTEKSTQLEVPKTTNNGSGESEHGKIPINWKERSEGLINQLDMFMESGLHVQGPALEVIEGRWRELLGLLESLTFNEQQNVYLAYAQFLLINCRPPRYEEAYKYMRKLFNFSTSIDALNAMLLELLVTGDLQSRLPLMVAKDDKDHSRYQPWIAKADILALVECYRLGNEERFVLICRNLIKEYADEDDTIHTHLLLTLQGRLEQMSRLPTNDTSSSSSSSSSNSTDSVATEGLDTESTLSTTSNEDADWEAKAQHFKQLCKRLKDLKKLTSLPLGGLLPGLESFSEFCQTMAKDDAKEEKKTPIVANHKDRQRRHPSHSCRRHNHIAVAPVEKTETVSANTSTSTSTTTDTSNTTDSTSNASDTTSTSSSSTTTIPITATLGPGLMRRLFRRAEHPSPPANYRLIPSPPSNYRLVSVRAHKSTKTAKSAKNPPKEEEKIVVLPVAITRQNNQDNNDDEQGNGKQNKDKQKTGKSRKR